MTVTKLIGHLSQNALAVRIFVAAFRSRSEAPAKNAQAAKVEWQPYDAIASRQQREVVS
jgi:hypothetical protein